MSPGDTSLTQSRPEPVHARPTSESTFEQARTWAAHWCQRWFLSDDGEDRLLMSNGVSAGWACHVEAYSLLLDLALDELGQSSGRAPIATQLKTLGFDRMVRSWGLRLTSSAVKREEAKSPVAFVLELPTPSMIEPAQLVAQEIPPEQRAVLCADPRLIRELRDRGIHGSPLVVPLAEQQRLLRRSRRLFDERIKLVRDSPPQMPLQGRDIAQRALQRVSRSLRRSLPWLSVEHRALQRTFEQIEPGAIAVASDQHRIGRLAMNLADQMGISTTVLQHGLPQAEIGYLPVVARRVAAWSEASASWFMERGTAPPRLSVLGNPRSDALAVGRAERSPRGPDSTPRVLLGLSLNAMPTNQAVVALALATVELLPAAELVVKLHPGSRRWSWVDRLVRASGVEERVRVVQHEDTAGLLRWADVTLIHRSSVAVDSLIAGTPVVVVEAGEPSVADVELSAIDLPRASNPSILASRIRAMVEPIRREHWFASNGASIARAVGPLDGCSAERIAAALLSDAARRHAS